MGYQSVNPLAIAEVRAWLEINGVIELGERRQYYELIMVMDTTFMRHCRELNTANE